MRDVLEHLMDPHKVLRRIRKHLKWDVFTYNDAGILDKTNVKMYTGVEIQRLMMRSDYGIEIFDGIILGEPDEQEERLLDSL